MIFYKEWADERIWVKVGSVRGLGGTNLVHEGGVRCFKAFYEGVLGKYAQSIIGATLNRRNGSAH